MDHNLPHKISAKEVCDVLGRRAMAKRLGVGVTQISNASVEGQFPARWFAILRDMCAEAGIDCPEYLFTFIAPTAPQEDAA